MNKKEVAGIVGFVLFFVVASLYLQQHKDFLQDLMTDYRAIGMLTYGVLSVLSVVIAPLNTFPLLLLAATLWGPVVAAILSILGWTIGSIIAYEIATHFGRPLTKKLKGMKKAESIVKTISGGNPFWSVLLMRMLVPVDVLSYALGLLVPMKRWSYALATLLGVTPFAFVFSYASTMPLPYMIGALLLAVGAMTLAVYRYKKAAKA